MSEEDSAATGQTARDAAAAQRGRRRPPTIEGTAADLTPAEAGASPADEPSKREAPVSDTITEPAPPVAEAAPAATPERPRPPVLLPLVAGVIGGVAAATLYGIVTRGESAPGSARQELSQTLQQRLSGIERGLAETQAAARADADRLTALGKTSAAGAIPDLKPLEDRIGKLEATLAAMNGSVATAVASAKQSEASAGRQADTLTGQINQLGERLAAADKALAALSAQQVKGNTAPVLAALTSLRAGLSGSRPLRPELDALAALGVEPAKLAPLQPYADAPAPSGRTLAAQLRDAVDRAVAVPTGSADTSLARRLLDSAAGLVKVRRVGESAGSDDGATASRAAAMLERGDFAGAGAEIAKLSPGAHQTADPVAKAIAARRAAGDAVETLERDSLAAVAGSAK